MCIYHAKTCSTHSSCLLLFIHLNVILPFRSKQNKNRRDKWRDKDRENSHFLAHLTSFKLFECAAVLFLVIFRVSTLCPLYAYKVSERERERTRASENFADQLLPLT